MRKVLVIFALAFCSLGAHAQAACSVAPDAFSASITPSATSALITWTTQQSGVNCLASTRYGNSVPARACCGGPNGSTQIDSGNLDTAGVANHSVTLTDLEPNSQYFATLCSWGFTAGVIDKAKTTCDYPASQGHSFNTTGPPTAATIDYGTHFHGAQHLYAGYALNFEFRWFLIQTKAGFTGDNFDYTFTLPAGFTLSAFQLEGADTFNSGTNVLRLVNQSSNDQAAMVLKTNGSVAPGTYNITIAATDEGQTPHVTHNYTYPVTVDPAPSFAFGTPASFPGLPNMTDWETWMIHYGICWAEQDKVIFNPPYPTSLNCPASVQANNHSATACGGGACLCTNGDESCSVYYDASWVFGQIKTYDTAHGLSGNPAQWDTAVANANEVYRNNYLESVGGGLPGYWVFALGLQKDCLAGDARSCTDLHLLRTASVYGTNNLKVRLPEVDQFRENFYMVTAINADGAIGNPDTADLDFYVNNALGHIAMWVEDGNLSGNQPFMDGLVAEQLYRLYLSGYNDPRIPVAIKKLADWLYTNYWGTDSSGRGFEYNSWDLTVGVVHPNSLANLNPLIMPMYAWLFAESGDTTYSTRTTTIWNGWHAEGASNLFEQSPWGKPFSQQYRSGFDTVKFMTTGLNGASTSPGLTGGAAFSGGVVIK